MCSNFSVIKYFGCQKNLNFTVPVAAVEAADGVIPNPNPVPEVAVFVAPPRPNPEACVVATGVAPNPGAPVAPPSVKPEEGVGAAPPSPGVAVVFGAPNREGKPEVAVAGVAVAPNPAG